MVTVWVVFCIAVLLNCFLKKKSNVLGKYILWFAIGGGILIVPVFLWLIIGNAFVPFIKDYILFNMMYVGNEVNSSLYNKYQAFSFFLNNIYVLTSVVVMGYLCKYKKNIFNITYFIYMFVTLWFLGMSGQTYAHYGMIIIPMLIYPFSYILGMVEKEQNHFITLGVSIYFLGILAFPVWISGVDRTIAVYHDYISEVEEPGNRKDTIGKVTQYIKDNTTADDTITVWGNWNLIYVLSGRFSTSQYSYQFPIQQYDDSILNTYFAELQANRPAIIVIQAGMELGEMETFVVRNYYELANEIDGVKIYKKDVSK